MFEGPLGERFERGSAGGVSESLKITHFLLTCFALCYPDMLIFCTG